MALYILYHNFNTTVMPKYAKLIVIKDIMQLVRLLMILFTFLFDSVFLTIPYHAFYYVIEGE